jgi:hypothetical protein
MLLYHVQCFRIVQSVASKSGKGCSAGIHMFCMHALCYLNITLVLMFMYCRCKFVVTKLVILWISHYTDSEINALSIS